MNIDSREAYADHTERIKKILDVIDRKENTAFWGKCNRDNVAVVLNILSIKEK